MVGYWKSECEKDYGKSPKTRSSRDYFQLVKHGKNGLKFKQFVSEEFTTTNCTGKSTFVNDDEENDVLTQKEIDKVTLQGNDKFIVNEDDGGKWHLYRVQPKDFPVVK